MIIILVDGFNPSLSFAHSHHHVLTNNALWHIYMIGGHQNDICILRIHENNYKLLRCTAGVQQSQSGTMNTVIVDEV